ncbi:MAG: winged helix-turn-helix transcriptional regulator [Acidobacteria bacterium]|nr:winged helix-turn-helix transcriptional regulator [Acidobacteriota bacterium]
MIEPIHRMAALGDATRREIFAILAGGGPSSVADLARRLPVTRPAVSQHLRVLKDLGLVTHQTVGTRHIYRLDPQGIAALRDYLDSLWERALNDFKAAAEQSFNQQQETPQ